ncbi:dual specificity protein phosphatase family protein [Nitrosococcus wardiae]|nr:dual specificity protein phosphatase [Nitrosococcus wardiae]
MESFETSSYPANEEGALVTFASPKGDQRYVRICALHFAPPLSNNFLLPQFPLTATIEAESDWPEIQFALEISHLDGSRQRIPMGLTQQQGPRRQFKVTFLPPQPGPYRIGIELSASAQSIPLFETEVAICEPRAHESWTLGPMITEIEPYLYIGNAAAAANPKLHPKDAEGLLERQGIRAVLNAAEERDPHPALLNSGIDYAHFPFQDFSHNPLEEARLWEAVQWMACHIEKKRSVFVHCHAGIGRSGSLVVAYLLLFGCPQDTFDTIVHRINTKLKLKGHYIYPHVGIPDTINTLRTRLASSDPAWESRYPPEAVSKIHAVSIASLRISNAPPLIEEHICTEHPHLVRQGISLTCRVRVDYQSTPPRGVYLLTNLNQDGPSFEKIFMSPTEEKGIFEVTVTPRRAGDEFWLTAYATPRRYDHELTAMWVGQDIRFRVIEQ